MTKMGLTLHKNGVMPYARTSEGECLVMRVSEELEDRCLHCDIVDEGVDGEQGAADHHADEAGHDDHKDRFDHSGDVINLLIELGFVNLGGLAEHFVDFAGFFADGGHLRNEREHVIAIPERLRKGFATLDDINGFGVFFFYNHVVDGIGGDSDRIEHRHAGGQHHFAGPGKARNVELAEKPTKDGDGNLDGVHGLAPNLGALDSVIHPSDNTRNNETDQPPEIAKEIRNRR